MRIRREFVPLFALTVACMTAGAQPNPLSHQARPILVTARAVHNLPPEEAARDLPVHLRAVVTYYDPYIDVRHAAIFVHDASGGVFVSIPARPILSIKPGALVDITGVTNAGDYAPVVSSNQVRLVGQSSLPANPPKVTLTQLLTGALDCQWVEVEGRVRSAHVGPSNVVLGVAGDGGMLTAVTVRQQGMDYNSLVDSLVRIDGNAAPLFNQRRQMVGVHLFFPRSQSFSRRRAIPSLCPRFRWHNCFASRLTPGCSTAFTCRASLRSIGRGACFAFKTLKPASACRRQRLPLSLSDPLSTWLAFPQSIFSSLRLKMRSSAQRAAQARLRRP
jgi:hypothetical protein